MLAGRTVENQKKICSGEEKKGNEQIDSAG
jgi:hypothetical protein